MILEKKEDGFKTKAIVETLDIFPTLCDLTGVETPEFVEGISLKNILKKKDTIGHSAVSYKQGASTLRTATHRLILHKDGFVELYDHLSSEKETRNISETHPDLVKNLTQELRAKLE